MDRVSRLDGKLLGAEFGFAFWISQCMISNLWKATGLPTFLSRLSWVTPGNTKVSLS